MSDISDASDPSDGLIARAIVGDLTPGEAEALRSWRAALPENEARYQEMARLAALAVALPETIDPGAPPTVAQLEHRLARRSGSRGRRPAVGRRQWLRWSLAAAATAVVALGAAALVLSSISGGEPGFEIQSFVTGPSEPATVTFRDGTVVRLAPDTRLDVHDFRNERRVSLAGRGYFAVASDPAGRPFLIGTPAGEVRVLGTRFDVTARAENLEVVVVEGRVALSRQGVETEVAGGQMGRVVNGTPLPAVAVEDPHERLGWVGKFLAFHSTPLASAAREIEHQYQVRIHIADPALETRTITTWFSGWELDDVMTVFCTIAEAHCTRDGDLITVEAVRINGA